MAGQVQWERVGSGSGQVKAANICKPMENYERLWRHHDGEIMIANGRLSNICKAELIDGCGSNVAWQWLAVVRVM
ncbi:hypothetical protein R6Q59_035010 [Mikania micrantha]